jgi:hypothetical protein
MLVMLMIMPVDVFMSRTFGHLIAQIVEPLDHRLMAGHLGIELQAQTSAAITDRGLQDPGHGL